jgi:Glycosyltransferase family 87
VVSSRYTLFIGILLASGLALNGFMAWQDRDLVRKGYPDFTIFYGAGKMVRAGAAGSLYDERAEFQAQRQFAPDVSIRHGSLPYNHPPFEALLFVPLTFLSYFPAYLAWDAVSLSLLGLAMVRLRPHVPPLRGQSLAVWILCALAFFPIFICLLQGQDMLLFFFLLTAGYVSLKEDADFLAGCWIGLGIFRPHLVLPLAIILLFSRRWKSVFGIACSSLAMAAVSIGVVGWRGFLDYPTYVWKLEQVMGRGAIVPGDMPNLRGFFAIFFRDGGPAALAFSALGSVFLLLLAIRLFRQAAHAENLELGFSVAVLVTILVSYHAFMYDLALLFLPVLLLFGNAMGRPRWESAVPVATLFFTPLLMFLWLRLSHLNLLTPVLLLWLWGMAREISLGEGQAHSSIGSVVPQT